VSGAALADVACAGAWLRTAVVLARAAPPEPGRRGVLALGLAITAALAPDAALDAAADAAARELAAAGAVAPDGPDAGPAGLVAALRPGVAPALDAARTALRSAARTLTPVAASGETCATALRGDEAAVTALCERAELAGVTGDAGWRRELGLALTARAFSAARAPMKAAFAMRLLRVVAARRLDPAARPETVAFVRRLQRVDGSFGHLPPRTALSGDLRLAFHLPWTVAALRALHDALAPVPLIKIALRSEASVKESSSSP